MKKLYTYAMVLGLAFIGSTAFGQSDAEIAQPMSDADAAAVINKIDFTPYAAPQMRQGTLCDTLNTPVDGGNSYHGVMFDVDATNDIFIQTFWVTVAQGAGSEMIAIFAKTGTHVGSETTPGDWTFLDSAAVTGQGPTAPVMVPVTLTYPMAAGSTHAFYVTATDPAATFHYSNGTGVGNTLTSNADLTVLEGSGGEYPFNVTFTPRNLNGVVDYCTGFTGVEQQELLEKSNVYPVPASDNVTVTVPGEGAVVEVISLTGQTVIDRTNVLNNRIDLDVSGLSSGLYFVNIMLDGNKVSKKLIVR